LSIADDSEVLSTKVAKEKDKLVANVQNLMGEGEKLSDTVNDNVKKEVERFLSNVQDWRHITEASISQTLASIKSTLETNNVAPKRVKAMLERIDGALLDFEADLTTAQQSKTGPAGWSLSTDTSLYDKLVDYVRKITPESMLPAKLQDQMNAHSGGNYFDYLKTNYFDPLATKLDSAMPTTVRKDSVGGKLQNTAEKAEGKVEEKAGQGKANAEAYFQQAREQFQSGNAYVQKFLQDNMPGNQGKGAAKNRKMGSAQEYIDWIKGMATTQRSQRGDSVKQFLNDLRNSKSSSEVYAKMMEAGPVVKKALGMEPEKSK
jgi:ElaB/YqjD/DUF883 family membrane-anchored ribosome-binding protein